MLRKRHLLQFHSRSINQLSFIRMLKASEVKLKKKRLGWCGDKIRLTFQSLNFLMYTKNTLLRHSLSFKSLPAAFGFLMNIGTSVCLPLACSLYLKVQL